MVLMAAEVGDIRAPGGTGRTWLVERKTISSTYNRPVVGRGRLAQFYGERKTRRRLRRRGRSPLRYLRGTFIHTHAPCANVPTRIDC